MQEVIGPLRSSRAKRSLAVVGGFLLGAYHAALLFYIAGSAGHGHEIGYAERFVGVLWFGYAAPLWFVLPPIQYALYAYVACRRLRRLGLALGLLHYLGSAALLVFLCATGNLEAKEPGNWLGVLADVPLLYGPFAVLNFVYFWRILSRRAID